MQALGMVFQGRVLIHRGQVEEGLALHDEGMVMAVGGGLSQLATVQIFCHVVRSCCDLGDYRRAEEWNRAIEDCFAIATLLHRLWVLQQLQRLVKDRAARLTALLGLVEFAPDRPSLF